MKTLLRSAGIALLAMVVCVPTAGADTAKCQRTIAKASSQFLQARVKALSKCNEGVVKAGAGTCPDQKTADSIAKAASKLEASIGKACGGDDKVCGGNTTNEDTVAAVGWPSTCSNFEKNNCTNAITDCSGISTCIECVAGAASDQAMTLTFGDIALQTADKNLNKCQATIGKATSAYINAASKALQKCWDARINGKHTSDCFPPSMGDGKYAAAIQKAKDKQAATICKACGGPDKTCDNVGDLTPAAIGFPSDCSYVTQPHGGPACGGPISTLTDIVNCTGCVGRFKADCVDALQVPQYEPYPAECTGCPEAPATGACPTSIEFNANGPEVQLDTGFTGLAHHAHVPTNNRLTLTVSGCSGVAEPNCGVCNVNGPIDNAGGPTFDNQRCQDAPWKTCDVDADCTSATQCVGGTNNGALCTTGSECPGGSCDPAGFIGPCIRYFGPPLPLRAGGVSTCVVNEISGPVSGTIDFGDGSTVSTIPLSSRVNISSDEFEPCPHCRVDGKCNSGARVEQSCIVSGTSLEFGTVSLDCPPNNEVAKLILNLDISTGTQTKTVEAANPTCRQTGYTGLKCLCDTCNNVNQEGCSLNADCPANGGGAGICGGLRCIGGTEAGQPCRTCIGGSNHGATGCTSDSACPGGVCSNPRICNGGANDGATCNNTTACPGGTCAECAGGGACNRPGEATQPNVCQGSGCVDVGNNQGECVDGPVDQVCSIQTFRTCSNNDDCACPECLPNQTCISRNRPCFTDNGVIGGTVTVDGMPDTPCDGVSKPTVGAFFCVAPTGAAAVNAAGGLPALGRVSIPGTVIVNH